MDNEIRNNEHIAALENYLELSNEYIQLQQEHLALIERHQNILTKTTEIFNLVIAENNTSNKLKALAKEVLKEVITELQTPKLVKVENIEPTSVAEIRLKYDLEAKKRTEMKLKKGNEKGNEK